MRCVCRTSVVFNPEVLLLCTRVLRLIRFGEDRVHGENAISVLARHLAQHRQGVTVSRRHCCECGKLAPICFDLIDALISSTRTAFVHVLATLATLADESASASQTSVWREYCRGIMLLRRTDGAARPSRLLSASQARHSRPDMPLAGSWLPIV